MLGLGLLGIRETACASVRMKFKFRYSVANESFWSIHQTTDSSDVISLFRD